eukprot:4279941-Pyramimonas_sp.AAC.1
MQLLERIKGLVTDWTYTHLGVHDGRIVGRRIDTAPPKLIGVYQVPHGRISATKRRRAGHALVSDNKLGERARQPVLASRGLALMNE